MARGLGRSGCAFYLLLDSALIAGRLDHGGENALLDLTLTCMDNIANDTQAERPAVGDKLVTSLLAARENYVPALIEDRQFICASHHFLHQKPGAVGLAG
ncbi:hypothetical protein [Sphingobium sp. WCS2017Hpa-17]|uniref:hypothetical protein n=1 Tax=Sphingobium sp. WCS2017Hpa-17 TaxID=3073638 RepID=UPI00288C5A87|nr:hypothetical protein [Sphingobium sp. WCS2017Hpa-17]